MHRMNWNHLTSSSFAVLDREKKVTYVSDRFLSITELLEEGVIGKSIYELPFSDIDTQAERPFSMVQTVTGKQFAAVCVGLKESGDSRAGTLVVLCHENDLIEELAGQIQGATRRVFELRAIIENSYEPLFITDGSGTIIMVNAAWEKICGLSRDSILGRTPEMLIQEGSYTASSVSRVLETGQTETVLLEMTAGSRQGQRILATGVPIYNEQGEIWRVVANTRDISEILDLKHEKERAQLLNEKYNSELRAIKARETEFSIVATSEVMNHALAMAEKIAETEVTVLISGETGVGKEVLARYLHRLSRRSEGPFVKINCAAIPNMLLESELFGYVSGAFTGAGQGKIGQFELANGGTILLDEIGELAFDLQAKILRVLQSKEFVKVGGSRVTKTDVRILAATNRDLEKMMSENLFRQDLYYRLNVLNIHIPPLRERRSEIPAFVFHFLDFFNKKHGYKKSVSTEVLKKFMQYDWPGNIRELENLMERLVILADDEIQIDLLPENIYPRGGGEMLIPIAGMHLLKEAVDALERQMILRAAKQYGSTRKMSKVLGISQPTVVRKMKYHDINLRMDDDRAGE